MSTEKNNQNRDSLLDFIVNSVPRMEAPVFFAARVSNLVQVERYSFAGSLQAFARRLVPVFMTLMIAACFAAYQLTAPDPMVVSSMFYDEDHLSETVSMEYVALQPDQ